MASAGELATWIHRASGKGYKGLRLLVRVGEAWSLVDQWAIANNAKQLGEEVFAEATANAEAFQGISTFKLEAHGESGAPPVVRAFSLTGSPSLNEPDRYDPRNDAALRLMLEQNDKMAKTMMQMVAAVVTPLSSMMGQMSSHVGALAETHSDALRVVREDAKRGGLNELVALESATRAERVNKLLEAVVIPGVQMAMAKMTEDKAS